MNKKILIVGPSWLGDMIMSQALFKVLKNKFSCTIDVIAPEWSCPILDRMEEISKSITLPVVHGKLGLKKRYILAKALEKENYDHAIILTNSWKSALIPFWSNIPQRTGWLGELRWGLLNDVRYLNKKKLPLMMERYVALAYSRGEHIPTEYPLPRLQIKEQEQAKVLTKFNIKDKNKKILALCPGAAYGSAKRWPENYFAEIANKKIQDGWDIWLFGSKQDIPVIDNVVQQISSKCYSFAGQLQLSKTVDLMSMTDIVISNDSGLMHMASSLGKYIVAIYGSTSPSFTPPFGKNARIVSENLSCSPCFKKDCPLQHHQCMKAIMPKQILDLLAKDGF